MAGSTTGEMFRVTTFGESHGVALGCVVDGCPAGLRLDAADIQADLDRRKPGQSALTTTRGESDTVEILSGVYEGTTLGTPIAMMVRNADARSRAYEKMREVYRPGHADFTWDAKFGVRDWRGGGRASARETVGRVAAGAVARKLLQALFGAEVLAWVDAVDQVSASVDPEAVRREQIEATPVRCPDLAAAARMIEVIEQARLSGDTVGGVVRCVARNVPAGLGEPVFDKLDGELGRALLSIPAAKGVEIGSGFASTHMRGTEHNDPFALDAEGGVITTSNRAGGMLGGISNGMPILAAVAFKPVATHFHPQQSVTSAPHELAELRATGRHDPCVLPRAAPIVEAMVCLVLADLALRQRGARLSP